MKYLSMYFQHITCGVNLTVQRHHKKKEQKSKSKKSLSKNCIQLFSGLIEICTGVIQEVHAFFISNTFISNTRMKLAKN